MNKKVIAPLSTLLLVFVLFSCSSNDDEPEVEQKEEETEITLEGNYQGLWNSTTDTDAVFTDFPVSAKIAFANSAKTRLRAEFFATSTLTSCCKDEGNDGTMTMNLDGDAITSFSFNDQIVDCTGSFTGTGSITSKDPYTIKIDFTGNDCDGNHVGELLFTRSKD